MRIAGLRAGVGLLALTVTTGVVSAQSDLPAMTFKVVDTSAPDAHFSHATNVDILGLKPGQTMEQVKAILDAEMPGAEPIEETLSGVVSNSEGAQVPISFVNAVKRVKNGSEIQVNFASQVFDNRVLSIERTLIFDQMMTRKVLLQQVKSKYGEPTFEDPNGSTPILYIFANSKLLPPGSVKPFNGCNGKRRENGRTIEQCGTAIVIGEYGIEAIKATSPCGSLLFLKDFQASGFFDPLRYQFREQPIEIDDPECDGLLEVRPNGSDPLQNAEFKLVDYRRSLGHQQALDSAIREALRAGANRDAVAQPKL